MSAATLHYIHDPFCGWCYGAAPLVKEARKHLRVVAHGGGMMAGSGVVAVTPQVRNYVMAHDRRIAELTGQPFGEAYYDELLCDTGVVFDSEPPTIAMLAAERIAGRGLDMLARLQIAHYVEGRRIAEPAVLADLAQEICLDASAFAKVWDDIEGPAVNAHFAATRRLMNEVGARGFPSFVLEYGERRDLVDIGRFLGNPEAFGVWVLALFPKAFASPAAPSYHCDAAGCAISANTVESNLRPRRSKASALRSRP